MLGIIGCIVIFYVLDVIFGCLCVFYYLIINKGDNELVMFKKFSLELF